MLRLLKKFAWVCLLVAGVLVATAFTPIGPNNEPYQTPEVGYNPNPFIDTAPTGPKDINEEYRLNFPVIYYACNQNFLEYFGSDGLRAVDAAAAIFNNLTNVSQYSADLSEFPLESQVQNYAASALGLADLKSVVMGILIEQMGLANPTRYVWTLHSRFRLDGNPPPCPDGMGYYVIKRNYDPVTSALDEYQASSYVNGTLYTYSILEECDAANAAIPPLLADALEIPVDPLELAYTAVAALTPAPRLIPVFGQPLFTVDFGLNLGGFYAGLTRDDAGGLRHLLRTNNVNWESTGPNTTVAATNLNSFQLLFTSNLTELVNQSLTNTPAALQALFPNLVILNSTPIFTNVVSTNVFFYLTNFPWSPAGTVSLAFQTNLTTNVVTWFSHSFGNVITNTYFTTGALTVLETSVGPQPWGSPGQLFTNVTARRVATNFVHGDYYILPTNSACGALLVSTQLVSVINLTNTPVAATNVSGATNINGTSFAQELVFHFTNRVFVINPVPCVDNPVGLRQGIERVRFVRRDFDSLLGQFYEPVTNQYVLNAVTNSQVRPQAVFRQVTQPDILFSAEDQTSPNSDNFTIYTRTLPFNTANTLPNLAGPGTLEPGTAVTFNKLSPFYSNFRLNASVFLDELSAVTALAWGSFDATTNAPVVYPNGTSLLNLENQVLIQVSPLTPLPEGQVGVAYTASFSVTGGSAPYVWSLAPGTPGLPPGLGLSAGGIITGTPMEAGTFDIVIRLTEGGMRTVDRPYEIKINP